MRIGIVLGYSTNSDTERRRVERAVELYMAGEIEKIVMAGGSGESEFMKEYAKKLGVKEKDILTENFSRSTAENLWYTREIFLNSFEGEIYLISSPWHKERVEKLASFYLKKYKWKFLPSKGENEEEIEKPRKFEKVKYFQDSLLLKIPVIRERPDVLGLTIKRLLRSLYKLA